MSLRGWRESPSTQVALAGLGLAIIVASWSLVRALRAEPIPETPATAIASLDQIRRGPARPRADIEATVGNDVFSIDRSAPAAPYRMPGEPDPSTKAAPPAERPLVLGTVVVSDGKNFATMQLSSGSPKLVHVGDRIGEWTVRAIERGKVVLVSTGGVRADVTVSKPGT